MGKVWSSLQAAPRATTVALSPPRKGEAIGSERKLYYKSAWKNWEGTKYPQEQ